MKKIIYHRDAKEVKYLIEKDPLLIPLFKKKEEIILEIDPDYFVFLVGTIISQQVSSKVSLVIFNRFKVLCEEQITPQKILNFTEEQMRGIGLSYQKIKYLKSLAECEEKQIINLHDLDHLENEQIISMLTQIKGIGIWSAQMFLMFSLGREDVFSVLDLGLRNALKIIYNQPDLTQNEIEKISEKWKPYRSIVSHFLWHAWDND